MNITYIAFTLLSFLGMVDMDQSRTASVMMVCPGAGPDTTICGFEYELQGNDSTGAWRPLCNANPGDVWFAVQSADTTLIKVNECGDYTLIYDVPFGPCAGSDTVVVTFEDPSTLVITNTLDISLELDVQCLGSGGEVSCDNSITVSGAEPPSLNWEFCGASTCESTIYEPTGLPAAGICVLEGIVCDTTIRTDGASQCLSFIDIEGSEFEDILEDVFDDLNLACDIPMPCTEIPPECIDTIIDTIDIRIPMLDGGLWHFVDPQSGPIPLSDTTLILIDGDQYALIVRPGSDFYGPGDIEFILWAVDGTGALVPLTTQVDLFVQWLPTYQYDTVALIDTSFVIVDSCDIVPCGGIRSTPAVIDIPPEPGWPCSPLGLTFNFNTDDQFFAFELDCANTGLDIEVCPGEFIFFDTPGQYSFTCDFAPGCSSFTLVEVFDATVIPVIDQVSTVCFDASATFDVSFVATGGGGQFAVVGFGVFNYGEVVIINGLPACSPFDITIIDESSLCSTALTVEDCCGCTDDVTTVSGAICEGESFPFGGDDLMFDGVYRDTVTGATGCDSIIELNLTVYPVSLDELELIVCEGEEVIFDGQVITDQGVYTAIYSDRNGCDSTIRLDLGVLSIADIEIDTILCEGDVIQFGGVGITTGGTYSDTLIGTAGCDSIITLQVEEKSASLEISARDVCWGEGDGAILIESVSGDTPFEFYLNGQLIDTSDLRSLMADVYDVQVVDANGCSAMAMAEIMDIPEPQVDLQDLYTICGNADLVLSPQFADTNNLTFEWDDGSTQRERTITESGDFWFEVTDPCGTIRHDFTVAFEEDDPRDAFYVPNVFTPNGDGMNDEFRVFTDSQVQSFELHIYDRWGDELIEFNSIEDFWDGSFLDRQMDPGVYVWWLTAEVVGCDGNVAVVKDKGDVTIVK